MHTHGVSMCMRDGLTHVNVYNRTAVQKHINANVVVVRVVSWFEHCASTHAGVSLVVFIRDSLTHGHTYNTLQFAYAE